MSIIERIRIFFSADKRNKKVNDDADSYPTHNIIYENDSSYISHYDNHVSTGVTPVSPDSDSSNIFNDDPAVSTGNDFSNDNPVDSGSSDF